MVQGQEQPEGYKSRLFQFRGANDTNVGRHAKSSGTDNKLNENSEENDLLNQPVKAHSGGGGIMGLFGKGGANGNNGNRGNHKAAAKETKETPPQRGEEDAHEPPREKDESAAVAAAAAAAAECLEKIEKLQHGIFFFFIFWCFMIECCMMVLFLILLDMEQMKEKLGKLLLGEDMSGGGKGVSSALALSNAITNLAGILHYVSIGSSY